MEIVANSECNAIRLWAELLVSSQNFFGMFKFWSLIFFSSTDRWRSGVPTDIYIFMCKKTRFAISFQLFLNDRFLRSCWYWAVLALLSSSVYYGLYQFYNFCVFAFAVQKRFHEVETVQVYCIIAVQSLTNAKSPSISTVFAYLLDGRILSLV